MNNIENLKIKGGEYVFLAVFVAIIAYSFGEAVGRDNTKASFLDSAYISYCDDSGEICYLDTDDGEKAVSCSSHDKCLVVSK